MAWDSYSSKTSSRAPRTDPAARSDPSSVLDPISAGQIERQLFALKQDYTIVYTNCDFIPRSAQLIANSCRVRCCSRAGARLKRLLRFIFLCLWMYSCIVFAETWPAVEMRYECVQRLGSLSSSGNSFRRVCELRPLNRFTSLWTGSCG